MKGRVEDANHLVFGAVPLAAVAVGTTAWNVFADAVETRSQEWFDEVLATPGEMREVALPDPVPLSNVR